MKKYLMTISLLLMVSIAFADISDSTGLTKQDTVKTDAFVTVSQQYYSRDDRSQNYSIDNNRNAVYPKSIIIKIAGNKMIIGDKSFTIKSKVQNSYRTYLTVVSDSRNEKINILMAMEGKLQTLTIEENYCKIVYTLEKLSY